MAFFFRESMGQSEIIDDLFTRNRVCMYVCMSIGSFFPFLFHLVRIQVTRHTLNCC